MGNSPSVPAVPNPSDVASTQQGYNTTSGQQSQQGSMVSQSNPYGNLNYAQTGTSSNGTPLYTATTTLSPQQQQLLSSLTGTQTAAGNQGQQLITGANYGAVSPSTAIGNATSGLTGAAVQQEQQYLQPFFQPQIAQLDTQLRNQDFDPSTPAYQQAMNNLLQSQGQTESGFVANIEPQMFQQALQTYNEPAQLGTSLAQFGAPTNPNQSFVSTPQLNIQPADYTGAVASSNQANMAAFQAQLQQNNAMMSGLFGIPTAVLGGLAKSGGLNNGLLGAAALA